MFREYTIDDKKLLKKVGERVRYLRIKSKLSQFGLAIKADIPKNQVGRIERSEINTSIVTLGRIATALEVDLVELF